MATDNINAAELRMDPANLYREEIFTDRRMGTIRVLAPVQSDGTADQSRAVVYLGEAQILTNMGPLPISFEIDALTLGEAAQKYADAAKEGVENAVRELQEMRRQQSSSILVPGQTGGLPGGMPPLGGAGKIKMP